ncbi:hypothetical protein FXO38_27699 [Capsicum annuum]|uniref:Uncharacterized protein n=1 Tax=Capsicum annuum TaxID=4072 RepID=A0A2G2YJT3_CAPAN|nr:hypothetical protein FXO38_27699 [Capsicum annuum]PHT69989.1 hypothetical protein T459_25093 [Capsicum annuum]
MGVQFFSLTSASIPLESLSIYMMKMYRDRGSPCLMPLDGLKKFILLPLTKIEIEEEVMHDRMSLARLSRIPKKKRVSFIKDHSSLSSFFKVNLKDHTGLVPLHFPEVSDILLNYDSLVRSPSIGKETSLGGADDVLKDGFYSIGNDLGDNLVTSVTESNGSKVFQVGGIPTFWNLANKSGVVFSRHDVFVKDVLAESYGLLANVIPELLVKEGVKPIRSRSFHGLERFDSQKDFNGHGKVVVEPIVSLMSDENMVVAIACLLTLLGIVMLDCIVTCRLDLERMVKMKIWMMSRAHQTRPYYAMDFCETPLSLYCLGYFSQLEDNDADVHERYRAFQTRLDYAMAFCETPLLLCALVNCSQQ